MRVIKNILLVLLLAVLGVWAFAYLTLALSKHEYAEVSEETKAAAQAYLDQKLDPVAAKWQWQSFSPETGIELRTGMIEHPAPRGMVVVIPGFTGTIEMLMNEVNTLFAAGFSVAAIEYRGQGASYRPLENPEKGYVEDYDRLAQDLAQFAESVRAPELPLFFYSISKGAHITLRMALAEYIDVDAFTLIVPMVKINTGDWDYGTVHTMASAMTALGLGTQYAPGQSQWPALRDLPFGQATPCNSNPEHAQTQSALFALQPELRTRGTTFRWLKESIESSNYILEDADLAGLSTPVLMVTAGIDTLVDTPAAQKVCNALGDCSEVHLPESRHCLPRENADVYAGVMEKAINHFMATLDE